jgi:hypothetical protein
MLGACGGFYPTLMTWLGADWYDVVGNAGTNFIIVVAPAIAFWLVRAARSEARVVSWRLLVPGVPFIGAVCGSFISREPADPDAHDVHLA